MERVNFKNFRGLNLVGDLYIADSDTTVIMSHGFTGDRHEWGKFDRVAESLNTAGYNVLTFDFSGSGESDDDSLTVDKQVDDLKCAIGFLKSKGLEKIALLGLSLGGLVSAKVWDNGISAMVFYAPVTNEKPEYDIKRFTPEQRKELDEKGYIIYKRDKGIRKEIKIDRQMIIERKTLNQKEVLSRIKIPVLIIHGDSDEAVPIEDSKIGIKYLPEGSRLEIIGGDNHFDENHYMQYVAPTVSWLKEHL